jgi:hypothetical protein
MRKFMLLMLVAVAGIAAPAAQADPPTTTPLTSIDNIDTTCGYPIAVHFVLNGETLKTFSSGDMFITGPLSVVLSANGKTVSMNISGPVQIRINPDGTFTFRGEGTNGGDLQTQNGLIVAFWAGPYTLSPTTGFPVLEHGTVLQDTCAALAP